MTRKGLALEMVIMMIILLVVAAVIIQIFLSQTEQGKLEGIGSKGKCELQKQDFINKCNSLCASYNSARIGAKAVDYCETYFGQDKDVVQVDWNCDKKANGKAKLDFGAIKLDVCENRIYCFMVAPCANFDSMGCRDVLCRSYTELYGDPDTAKRVVADRIQTGEAENVNCRLPFDPEPNWDKLNWYVRFGYGENRGSNGEYTPHPNIC
ncbi:MAG: hypothetical protein HYX24_00560 [Candidatus Aenigmarchaeota archaeon]|nr:hypothetical protein [Candidatus Aenigmarchaeota archaeon]